MGIKLNKVSYQDKLKNINYEFEDGKITSIIGSSGSGKTLLSYLIAGVQDGYTGSIDNPYKDRDIGYVFQNPEEAFIFNSVREEISFGLEKYNYKINILNKRIEESLKIVGLPIEYLDKNPFQLSNGEKALLSLAIILAYNPKLIIIDDPTIYLDNKKEEYLIALLKKIRNKYHKTIIILINDISFAIKVTDNYLLLKNGKIISNGNKKELLINNDKIKLAGMEAPNIIDFITTVNKKKNTTLELTFDIKELMKDIYRNVR